MDGKPMSAALLNGGRKLADPQLSPDGNAVSFLSGPDLALTPVVGGAEVWLPLEPSMAGTRAGGHAWLPDGSGIAYIGVDKCLHVFVFEEWQTRSVTTKPESMSALAMSPDGNAAAYVSDLRDVVVVQLDGTSWPVKLSGTADFAFDPAWSPDSNMVVWQEWDVPNMPWNGSRLVARGVDATDEARVIAGGHHIGVQQPRFSPDGKYLSFLSDENGWLNVWVMDAATLSNARPLFEEEFEHGEPQWGPSQRTYAWADGGAAMFVTRNDNGFGKLVKRRVADGFVVGDRAGTYSGLHASGNRLVGLVTDAQRATEVEVLDDSVSRPTEGREARGAFTIARGSYLGVEGNAVVPELVEWESSDGMRIPGRLYRTPVASDGPPPLLVWIHGGPIGCQSGATFFPRSQYFLERGWSVLVPDYRGTNGHGRSHVQALNGHYGDMDIEDVATGIRAAFQNQWGEPERTVAVGGSSAGLTVLSMLARYPELCKAGVTMYPVADILGTIEGTWRFEAHSFDTLIGPLPQAYQACVDRSPVNQTEHINAPVLVLHGDADDVVPISQAHDLVGRMQRAGKPVEFHVYEGEGHGWRKPATRIDELERIDQFLRKNVLRVL